MANQNVGSSPNTDQDNCEPENSIVPLRRSIRTRYPVRKFADYEGLSLQLPEKIVEPLSYRDQVKDPRWMEAMSEEISAMHTNRTWQKRITSRTVSTTTKEMYERSVLLRSEHRVKKLEKALLIQREMT